MGVQYLLAKFLAVNICNHVDFVGRRMRTITGLAEWKVIVWLGWRLFCVCGGSKCIDFQGHFVKRRYEGGLLWSHSRHVDGECNAGEREGRHQSSRQHRYETNHG